MKTPHIGLLLLLASFHFGVRGQVGIGTNTPLFTLQVIHQNGSPAIPANKNGIAITHVNGPTWVLYASATDSTLIFYRNGIKELVVDANGFPENVSDLNAKMKISDIASGQLLKIMELRPKKYVYKNQVSTTFQYGLIAQELNEVYPDIVHRGIDNDGKEFWTISYTKLLPFIIKAIQEQQQILQNQEKRIENLETQIISLLNKK